MLGPLTIFSLIADSQKHAVTPADSATRTRASIAAPKDILMGKKISCGTRRGKLYYLDWAPYGETKVGQAFTTRGTCSGGERGCHSASKGLVASGKQPVTALSSSNTKNMLQNDRSPIDSDRLPIDSDWSPEENN
ncbi:hypothetical protein L3X38_044144 [Prunus dulcis]|uniref:Uncharacterized protein n=1 Tax=Prunus dulcis TaxID=3755 RepID=A0AAD4UZ72_PRUDU|nr:hypothetical protein L3X38_044144 [Prunus dulcis]